MGHVDRIYIPQRINDLRRNARVQGLDKIFLLHVSGG
jgi:hypothetical protein